MLKPESPLHSLMRRQSYAFLVAALAAASVLIILGAQAEHTHPLWSRLLITMGSSGFGTCFGLVIGTVTGASAVTRIKELVESTVDSSLLAEESALDRFRTVVHHYLKTRVAGKSVWRYRTLDFSRVSPKGKLFASLNVRGPDSQPHSYLLEGYLVSERLVVIQRPAAGTEHPAIHVYPFAGQRFRDVIVGTVYLQSWDGDELETEALMSFVPLEIAGTAKYEQGTLPDACFAALDEKWERCAQAARLNRPAAPEAHPVAGA